MTGSRSRLQRGRALHYPLLGFQPLFLYSGHIGASGLGVLWVLLVSNLNSSPRLNSGGRSVSLPFPELMTILGSGPGPTRKLHAFPFQEIILERVIKSLLPGGKSTWHRSGYQPFCSTRLFTSSNRVSVSCHLHHIS